MMITRELADAGKKLGEGDGGQYEAMHELFTQIAEGPEVTVEASTMDTPSQLGSRMGCGPGMILL